MGKAAQVIATTAANPGAGAAFAANVGDTLAILNFDPPARARLIQVWGSNATGGVAKIKSPRLHDNINGIEAFIPAASGHPVLTGKAYQNLYAQDVLAVSGAGGAAESDLIALLVDYDDVPGLAARLTDWNSIASRIEELMSATVTMTAGVAIGSWAAGKAINTTDDQFRANRDYALLGYTTDTEGGAVRVTGPDTGNLGIGGPLTKDTWETRNWFVAVSDVLGQPFIPVIAAPNKGATLVSTAQAVAGTAVNVVLHFALLTP